MFPRFANLFSRNLKKALQALQQSEDLAMVKSYLKFQHSTTFGQVSSASSNVIWLADTGVTKSQLPGKAVVSANEEVLIWDLKKGELDARWNAPDNKSQVTSITRSAADPDLFAVGYEDGKIRIWDAQTATAIIIFNGHRSGITQLKFDSTGARLISGSKDTDIIVWDLVAEVGLFKLRGHKDQITSLSLLSSDVKSDAYNDSTSNVVAEDFLLSTSKDGLMKLWSLSTQNCVETHVAQINGECWALSITPDASGCISAGSEGELRAWSIDVAALTNVSKGMAAENVRVLRDRGSFYRQGKDRTIGVSFHLQRDFLAVHGQEKSIEIWRIRSAIEIQKTLMRKWKRKKEKAGELDIENDTENLNDGTQLSDALITDIFVPYSIVRTAGKVRSTDWASGKSGKSISILVGEANNQIEMYSVDTPSDGSIPDYQRTLAIEMPGHRSDIRCLTVSSDDRMLASASQGSLKIWNLRTQSCIRTLDCGHALCATFLPGDKIVVIGTRDGKLEIFDIASSTLISTIEAHEKDIWSMQVEPDGRSLVTGSADKSAKFWQFKVIQEQVLGTERTSPSLTLVHTRTLKLNDDILSLRFSPDGRLIAISTLDMTVKVFFLDTLKLYLTLYGHKLPVLSMDISYDSKLIVTSSADKNVRVWGLDFGDCHKTFFAHQDSILAVAFVPNNDEGRGHQFFSASKDRVIKYFDGDKFEMIQKLEGHHGEIWALEVAHTGKFLVSASHDKSIRLWEQTDEQLFLEEEREKELEELYENTLVTSLEQNDNEADAQSQQDQVVAAGKQTVQTLMAGEKIAEALELGLEDLEMMKSYSATLASNPKAAAPQRNPVFVAKDNISAPDYVLDTFRRIPSASLHDALLVLSFSQLPALFTFLQLWAATKNDIALTCRVLFFMIKVHQKQLVSNRLMRRMLIEVKQSLRQALEDQKQELGFNMAGTRILQRRLVESGESEYVDLERTVPDGSLGVKKRTFINIA